MFRVLLALATAILIGLYPYFRLGGQVMGCLHRLPLFLLLVPIPVLCILWGTYPRLALKEALLMTGSESSNARSEAIMRHGEYLSYAAGIIAFLLDLIQSTGFLDMPSTMFGPRMAMSLLGIVLGIVQATFFRSLRARLR